MWHLIATLNYPDGELENSFEFNTIEALVSFIQDDLKKETDATSFVFVVSKGK